MWRQEFLNHARQCNPQLPLANCDVWQLGVYSGVSMERIAEFYASNGIKVSNMIGLDCFDGMPEETEEEIYDDAWLLGGFNGVDLWKMSIPDICSTIEEKVSNIFKKYNQECNVKIIPGLVQNTLPLLLKDGSIQLNQISYVDVDFDLYSPSKFALEMLLENGLISKGSLIGYDDFGTEGWWSFKSGESRAHKETFIDQNIPAEQIFQWGCVEGWNIDTSPHIQTGFVILKDIK